MKSPLPPELNAFVKIACRTITPVGSRVTCDPAPTDTDDDRLCLVHNVKKSTAYLVELGFVTNTDPDLYEGQDQTFTSMRRRRRGHGGELNLLLTQDKVFHQRFLAATGVAKQLNLLRKSDRVMLFQAVLYAVGPE